MGWNIGVVDLAIKDISEFTFEFHDIPCTGVYQFWTTDQVLTQNVVDSLRNAKCMVDCNIKPWLLNKYYKYFVKPPYLLSDMPEEIHNRENDKPRSFMCYHAEDIVILYNKGKI